MLTRLSLFALALNLLTACATTGSHAGLIGATAEAQQQKTVVTVIHPRGFPVSFGYDIYQEDEAVGNVAPGKYLVWETVVPSDGRLLVSAKGFQNDMAVLRPEPGASAYLKVEVGAGPAVATMRLVPITQAEAEAFMQKGKELASAGR